MVSARCFIYSNNVLLICIPCFGQVAGRGDGRRKLEGLASITSHGAYHIVVELSMRLGDCSATLGWSVRWWPRLDHVFIRLGSTLLMSLPL